MENQQINDAMRRSTQYWNIDGLPEIGVGLFWVAMSFFAILPEYVPRQWKGAPAIAMMIVIPLGSLLMGRVMKSIKRRVTEPRTGYMKPRKPSGAVRIASLATAILVAMGLVFLVREGRAANVEHYMVPFLGLITGISLYVLGLRSGVTRLCWLGVLSVVAGIVLAFVPWSFEATISTYFGVLGIFAVISGSLHLHAYMRDNPVRAEVEP
jgi:hypothetical protein